jgi:hypothetical protein
LTLGDYLTILIDLRTIYRSLATVASTASSILHLDYLNSWYHRIEAGIFLRCVNTKPFGRRTKIMGVKIDMPDSLNDGYQEGDGGMNGGGTSIHTVDRIKNIDGVREKQKEAPKVSF